MRKAKYLGENVGVIILDNKVLINNQIVAELDYNNKQASDRFLGMFVCSGEGIQEEGFDQYTAMRLWIESVNRKLGYPSSGLPEEMTPDSESDDHITSYRYF